MTNPDSRFKAGNICRIYVKDFLTFDEIEVRPNPHLNFIIGPNGTGKSTILCAICICLGGKPSITGRGKEVSDYVKHGKTSAILETEIYVEGNKTNIIIRREFDRKKKSTWFLQGTEVLKKVIESKIASLNIQVDNLCQFLPQDRVANFAKMNRIELLEATEKAVGDTSLFEQHDLLLSSGHRMRDLRAKLKKLESELDTAIKRNAGLKDAVKNHETKNDLDKRIEKLKKMQLWFLYDEKRKKHTEVREDREQLRIRLENKRKDLDPSHNKIAQKKTMVHDLKKLIREKVDEVEKKEAMDENFEFQYETFEEYMQDVHREFTATKQEEEQRERELVDLCRQMDVLNGQLQNLPEIDDDLATMNLKKLTDRIQDASQNIAKLHNRQQEAVMVKRSAERSISAFERELASIQDVSHQRLELLNKRNPDAYLAAQWLEKNQGRFAAPVHLPMCTLLNVKDPKFAKYVENRVSGNDLVSFVCENKDDMNLFKELMDKQSIRVNIVYSTATDLTQFKPQVPLENLRQFGFQWYMLDCIDAPPAILSYLCRNYDVHRIPIAEKGDYSAVPPGVTFFFMGDQRYSKSRSRYDGEWSTTIYPIRNAELLHIILDTQRIERIEQEISKNKESIIEAEQTLEEVKKVEVGLLRNLEDWRNEKRVLLCRRDEKLQLLQRINQKKNQIIRRKQGAIDLQDEENKMKAKLEETVKKMVAVTIERGEAIKKSVEECQEYYKFVGKVKRAMAEVQAIEERVAASEQELASFEEMLENKTQEVTQYKLEAQGALQKLFTALKLNSVKEGVPKEIRELVKNTTLEETEKNLTEFEAHRDCLIIASDSEVKEFNTREAEVQVLQKKLDNTQVAADNHHRELEESRLRWLPRISELIENIDKSFAQFMGRLGCAGEISLDKGEMEDDFSKYGIMIKVRFRDNDRLRELTAQHQSGGERAVSTALYLLALQSLTSVPFRCVDEINQGMDPINERQMLNMLMETVASECSSQYFFVSPKLIPDMIYNDYVNVMVVFNSQTMLPHRKFNLKRLLRKRTETNNRHSRQKRVR
ncbi:structural maintenance of chromosomes protein 5-like [Homarus americanus]|uniref:structural maintenance of chromosomes protein 5-like n=1 Tax=Homarus americanus TaxID=6706 RepID=UPI001C448289|nr:structural maintenance of chromosomes protein 5-like [Homarus americanus]